MNDDEDKILYRSFLNGSNESFEAIVKKYKDNLIYFIFKYVNNLDIAEEIFQDVIMYVFEKKELYNFDYSLKSYLFMIAKSRSLNYIKHIKNENDIVSEENLYEEENLIENIICGNERNEKIHLIINELNEEHKMVVYLCIIEGMSYEEVSKIMGKSISQIKNLLHRARTRLRKKLIQEKVVEIGKNNKIKFIISILVIISITTGIIYALTNNKKQASLTPIITKQISNVDFNVLWTGSFQLAWNELKDQIGQDIIFEEGNLEIVEELNKENFSKEMISDNSYYIKSDETTLNLKKEIEKDLKRKKLLKEGLLDVIDFSEDLNSYTIYAILQKEFEFQYQFDRLPDGYFGDNNEIIVKYFGITSDSDSKLFENVEILFFNNKKDFAIKLLTKNNEELILVKDDGNNSFDELYQLVLEKSKSYNKRTKMEKGDTLTIPFIEIDTIINYDELCGKVIKETENKYIKNAFQNVVFYLNEKGGKLTSEASITQITQSEYLDSLEFDYSSQFYIFMKEKEKEVPYMALKVDNTDILVENTK